MPRRDVHGADRTNLTDVIDGFLIDHRCLIIDRDGTFSPRFKRILEDSGAESIRCPARLPAALLAPDGFVLSIKSECLCRMIFLGEASLRRAIGEHLAHDHAERAHQGLINGGSSGRKTLATGTVECRERLGGILKHYRRAA